jgi:Ca2+-transporting ATPase
MADTPTAVSHPWARSVEDVLGRFGTNVERGLDESQVGRLLMEYGPNRLQQAKAKSLVGILVNQFKSLIVVLLAVAAIVSLAFREWLDAGAIGGVILINAAIGFFMELKAVRGMEALRRMERVTARVRRNGQVMEISAADLVCGDIVLVEGGDIISADMRLIKASKLQADESVLTGESVPVGKSVEPLDEDAVLGDRGNMLFKGTALTRGSGEAVVAAVGMGTELGQISALVEEAGDSVTPLEKRLDQLGRKLVGVTFVIIAIVAAAGILRGKEIFLMIETAIALAVAAIPEGLPIVATLALARGMIRMARRNALLNELAAVETLGGIGVICTDKTGTLTENKMTVIALILADGRIEVDGTGKGKPGRFTKDGRPLDPNTNRILKEALEVAVLCNNASLDNDTEDWHGSGDPLEVSLLAAGRKAGIDNDEIMRQFPEVREEAFDSDAKRMATYNKKDDVIGVSVKGATEAVLACSTRVATAEGDKPLDNRARAFWDEQHTSLAKQGYRVLALAAKQVDSVEAAAYEGLTFLGLVVMADPPRADVPPAVSECRKAGIRVVMITGDHPETARTIAKAVGIADDDSQEVIVGKDIVPSEEMSAEDRRRYEQASIFARVSPRQKLDLIDVHQKAGSAVAMTGDGVNDAPALKKADIGIAMGLRGTQVAREAADMVLKDDAFATIVVAVEQGRIIFDNIRKFVLYLLSCNLSEVMVVFVASMVNRPLPILPLQILFLNLVTDVFPALALGVGRGNPGIMDRPPRPADEPVLPPNAWLAITGYGTLITISVLAAFEIALKRFDMSAEEAVTVSFLTLAFAQLWNIFNMRATDSDVFRNEITENASVWAALAFCFALLVAAVYLPGLSDVLNLKPPHAAGWTLIVAASLLTLTVGQAVKIVTAARRR